jgi:hypothetical protein
MYFGEMSQPTRIKDGAGNHSHQSGEYGAVRSHGRHLARIDHYDSGDRAGIRGGLYCGPPPAFHSAADPSLNDRLEELGEANSIKWCQ